MSVISMQEIQSKRLRLTEIRQRAREMFEGGATGVQVATSLSNAIDEFIVDILEESLLLQPDSNRDILREHSAIVAVGGNGRGKLAPFSDVDLLFLYEPRCREAFEAFGTAAIQMAWDARMTVGHATRTIGETISLARQEIQIATALVEARHLWGSPSLTNQLIKRFCKSVARRRRTFIDQCIASRAEDWPENGPSLQELEPDVKKSYGGLRELHLMRWVAFAQFGSAATDHLRLSGAVPADDFRRLREAREFLTRLRMELHFHADRESDILTRDEQLRIAEKWGYSDSDEQRGVEIFMQAYFEHSLTLARIRRQFTAGQQTKSLFGRARDFLARCRADDGLLVGPQDIDVTKSRLKHVGDDLTSILKLYRAVTLTGRPLAPRLIEAIKLAAPNLPKSLTAEQTDLFRQILGNVAHLGWVLRNMHETTVLDRLIPDMAHARCLMQFNQYHAFTVDEHTLQAIEKCTSYAADKGPLGTAYGEIRRKDVLHLAVLLHDLGKGFGEPHSEVGRRIADRIGVRLGYGQHEQEQLSLLVHQHLEMARIAFAHDISDPQIQMNFSRLVSTPDTLRMLYVLTAADVSAVGPGVWTDWKGELLANLYDGCMLMLTGMKPSDRREERLREIKQHVSHSIVPVDPNHDLQEWQKWIDQQLDAFSDYYLMSTPEHHIAEDLDIIQSLPDGKVHVRGRYERERQTVEYRVIMREAARIGPVHKLAGVLTAKHLEVLSADINTTTDGIVVDSFRVHDDTFDGEVPAERIEDVCKTIEEAMHGNVDMASLFQRHKRFGSAEPVKPISNLTTQVKADNRSAQSRSIIEVFAHDRRGLFYTITETLFQCCLSIDLAKIATHYDQIVDVFYVTDPDGRKLSDEALDDVCRKLQDRLEDFQRDGYQVFVT